MDTFTSRTPSSRYRRTVTLFGNIDAGVLRAMLRQLPSAIRQKPCELGDIQCRRDISETLNADLTAQFGKASDVTIKTTSSPALTAPN